MRHLVTLIWSLILLQMVNFVLNSLNGGGTLNFITPVIIAVIFTLFVILISSMNEAPRELEHSKNNTVISQLSTRFWTLSFYTLLFKTSKSSN